VFRYDAIHNKFSPIEDDADNKLASSHFMCAVRRDLDTEDMVLLCELGGRREYTPGRKLKKTQTGVCADRAARVDVKAPEIARVTQRLSTTRQSVMLWFVYNGGVLESLQMRSCCFRRVAVFAGVTGSDKECLYEKSC
jgi:hypothetical protein